MPFLFSAFAEFTIEDEKKLGQEFMKMVNNGFLIQDKG